MKGKGVKEIGTIINKKTLIKIDPNYYRPNEIYNLRGDYQKQKNFGMEAQNIF